MLRTGNGNIIQNEGVAIEIAILQGSASGTEVFSESHSTTTNAFGQVSLTIGSVNTTGMATIDWSAGPYYLKISMDGIEMGTSQLLSVPYALHATEAGNTFSSSYNDLSDVPVNMDTDYTDDFDGSFMSLTSVPAGLADGDDDTQLNEAQVDAFVSDNGYLTSEVDGSVSNEIQILSMSNDTIYLTNGGYVVLPTDTSWNTNGNNVYTYSNVGVGTPTPAGKFEVIGEASALPEDPLFEVKRNDGQTVFAVYNEGVRIFFDDEAKGARGGFAVGGFSQYKAGNLEYLRVTQDSVRIYINDSTSKGARGGFAVGGFSQNKEPGQEFLRVTNDSVRVYINDESGKGSRGGFAVGGFSQYKAPRKGFLHILPDSTRVYVDGDGGFSVDNIATGLEGRYLDLTPENYFIGHRSGSNNTIGLHNSFIGYESGVKNTEGDNNLFLGYQAGFLNETGSNNTFIGYESGYKNLSGYDNLFLGYQSGYSNEDGDYNTFIGYQCGYSNVSGNTNLFLGYLSGYSNYSGNDNLFIGKFSGNANYNGSDNTFIGSSSGRYNYDGDGNMFVGSGSGTSNTSGDYNTFIGSSAGAANTLGSRNTFIGYMSGVNNIGDEFGYGGNNTFVGHYSGYANTFGYYNNFFGFSAGSGTTTGARNVCMGDQSLYNNQTGHNNTCIGYQAGYSTTGTGGVYIGCYAGYNDTLGARLYIDNSQTADPLIWGDFLNNRVVINGNSGDNPNNRTFYANGTAGGNTDWFNDSDVRLKKNIQTIPDALNKVLRLRGVNFEWKDENTLDKGVKMGFIAQEAEAIIPEVVDNTGDHYSMQYASITALLVEALKEQQKIIKELQTKNQEQMQKIRELEENQKEILIRLDKN